MPSAILGILINFPLLIAAIATLVLWSHLKHRFLFLITAALSLLGLQNAISAPLIGAFLPSSGLTRFAVISAFEQGVVASTLAGLFIGVPFLWWLQRAFRKP